MLGRILASLFVAPPPAKLIEHHDEIARLFASDSYEDVLAALAADGGDWAKAQIETLATKSPQTCKVALRQLKQSRACATFADNMAMEYRIASRVLTLSDFTEGVRAVILDRDNAPRDGTRPHRKR